MQPLSQAIMLEAFPPKDRGKAMGFWGLGIVVAPMLGPVLGGWLDRQLLLALGVLHQSAGRADRLAHDSPVCFRSAVPSEVSTRGSITGASGC